MEFKVIKRNGNAVIPDGMFKLCGMEDAKLISMVQLNGGILLMPESVSTYQLLMLIDALNEQACEFLEAVAAECGPAEAEHRDMTLDEVLREFTVAVPDWAREKAGITADTKLDCEASEDAGVIAVYPASYRHDLTDVPRSILQCLLASGHSLYALNDTLALTPIRVTALVVTVPVPARTAAAIRGCCKVSRRLPVPAMVTEAIRAPAVRPRTKPSTQPVTAILMEAGSSIQPRNTGAKPIAGTAAIRITNTPATA